MISSLQGQTKFKHTSAQLRQHWGLCHCTPRSGLAGEELRGAREAEITEISPFAGLTQPLLVSTRATQTSVPHHGQLCFPASPQGLALKVKVSTTHPESPVQHGVQSWPNGPRGGNWMRMSPHTESRADPTTCCCWKKGSPLCPPNTAFPARSPQVTGALQIPHTANPTC